MNLNINESLFSRGIGFLFLKIVERSFIRLRLPLFYRINEAPIDLVPSGS